MHRLQPLQRICQVDRQEGQHQRHPIVGDVHGVGGPHRHGYQGAKGIRSRLLTSAPDEPPGPADNFFDRLEAAGLAKRIWQDGGGRWRILAL